MRFILLPVATVLLMTLAMACQSTATPNPTSTPYPTYTPPPTYTPYPTYTPQPQPTVDRISATEREQLVWPTGPRDDVIPYKDAAAFMGETVTVEGTIIDTHRTDSVTFLNFSPNRSDFKAVVFADDRTGFPSPPGTLFDGKLVRVKGLIEEYQGGPEIIINSPAQIEVALTLGQAIPTACNCDCPAPTPCPVPASAPAPPLTDTTVITSAPSADNTEEPMVNWQDAATYQGQTVTVKGQVNNTYNSGKVIFLNFDRNYRHTFKVVIFPEAWSLFPASPDEYYQNKNVAVTGQIEMYQDAPEIIVNHPDQIRILE